MEIGIQKNNEHRVGFAAPVVDTASTGMRRANIRLVISATFDRRAIKDYTEAINAHQRNCLTAKLGSHAAIDN